VRLAWRRRAVTGSSAVAIALGTLLLDPSRGEARPPLPICLPCVCTACPVLHAWPTDPPPCDASSTLQACIDAAAPGDGVLIETDGPIDESISFSKGLSLGAGSGYHPVFSSSRSILATSSTSGDQTIRIQGLRLQEGSIEIMQKSTGVLTAQVLDNWVRTSVGSIYPGVLIYQPGQTGPVSFDVSGNLVQVSESAPHGQTGIAFSGSAAATGTVEHNEIVVDPGDQATGISVGDSDDFTIDVIANDVYGTGYNQGISLEALGATTARILDNLVTGQAGHVAGPGAISIYASGSLQATVVNNTLPYNAEGVTAETLPGSSSLVITNNAVTANSFAGFSLTLDHSTTLAQDHNLFYANGVDIESVTAVMPGPRSVFANPNYQGPGDYRIVAPSPAIDAGDDAAVPPDLDTDFGGNPRIQGSHVDIGAYEVAPEPAGGLGAAAAVLVLHALGARARGRARPGSSVRWSGALTMGPWGRARRSRARAIAAAAADASAGASGVS